MGQRGIWLAVKVDAAAFWSKTGGSGNHAASSMALRVEDAEGDGSNEDGSEDNGDSMKRITLRILYDRSVLEIYDGTSAMSHRVYPSLPMDPVSVSLRSAGAVASVVDADVYEMANAVNFEGPTDAWGYMDNILYYCTVQYVYLK